MGKIAIAFGLTWVVLTGLGLVVGWRAGIASF
jgi:hypothetical protein